MTEKFDIHAIPAAGLASPKGRLYPPQPADKQILILVLAFFLSLGLGWLVGLVPGGLSDVARIVIACPYVLIFFLGYGLWLARANAIAYSLLGHSLLKSLFRVAIKKQPLDSVADALPDRDKLIEMFVRVQKAGASFRFLGWPIGILAGLLAMLFDSTMSTTGLFLLVAITSVVWGYVLAWLGRHGWLPIPEEG